MSKIGINQLSSEIQKILEQNAGRITNKVNILARKTANNLTKDTKKSSPEKTGEYKKHISNKKVKETSTGATYVWYVKRPEYRLTHLIANGHTKRNGGCVAGNFPLVKEVEKAEKNFTEGIKEIIKNEC